MFNFMSPNILAFALYSKTYSEQNHQSEEANFSFASSLRRYSKEYIIAQKIHEDACPEISGKMIQEILNYKWLESEKAGFGLWDHFGDEENQIVEAGRLWASLYWISFKNHNRCKCSA